MKLQDFLLFAPLNHLREEMGNAPLADLTVTFNHIRLTVDELNRLSHAGIEVGIDEIKVLQDGTLAYKNSRVLVYIRDVPDYSMRNNEQRDLPRFHTSHCTTLQEMREKNRWGRYVVATREDGKFEIRIISKSAEAYQARIEELVVCKNCLAKLSYKGYSTQLHKNERNHIVQQFSMVEFFLEYTKMLHAIVPDYDSDSAQTNSYTSDFSEISNAVKRQANWTCYRCRTCLAQPSRMKYLSTHHLNGMKYDNSTINLVPLCIRCHAEEPNHNHIKALPEYREFIKLMGGS